MAVLLDVIHEAVKRDGSLHRHAVLATDLCDVVFDVIGEGIASIYGCSSWLAAKLSGK